MLTRTVFSAILSVCLSFAAFAAPTTQAGSFASGYSTATGGPFSSVSASWRTPYMIYDANGCVTSIQPSPCTQTIVHTVGASCVQACGTFPIFISTYCSVTSTAAETCVGIIEFGNGGGTNIGVFGSFPIKPGDSMTGTVTCTVNCVSGSSTWHATLVNNSAGWTFTSSDIVVSSVNHSLAAWQIWADQLGGTPASTGRFALTGFTNVSVNGGDPGLNNSTTTRWTFHNGATVNSYYEPSQPSGQSFNVCWGSGSAPSCGAPDGVGQGGGSIFGRHP